MAGAVSLTFDDGMRSQLERAIPILGEYNLRVTFYINPRGEDWMTRMAPWRDAAQTGHEVGNHTVNHPCSWAFRNQRDSGLEAMTLEDMDREISEGKRRIEAGIPEQTLHTFCYPCYHTHVGEGPTRQSYTPVVARYHPAGRVKGDMANHPLTTDLHHLFSYPVERHSAHEMIGLVEESVSQGRWAVLTFHGVHEGHLSVAEPDFRALCAHLDRSRNRIWTAPVVAVAGAIAQWRQKNG
jgi:peptidoglycan/xylan/chitin deacetylase (PgdA/CDA1 family)